MRVRASLESFACFYLLCILLQVFRVFRALRPLRVVVRSKQIKTVLSSLYASLPAIGNVMLFTGMLLLVFGVLGVNFFKGRFFFCTNPDVKFKVSALCKCVHRTVGGMYMYMFMFMYMYMYMYMYMFMFMFMFMYSGGLPWLVRGGGPWPRLWQEGRQSILDQPTLPLWQHRQCFYLSVPVCHSLWLGRHNVHCHGGD